jgi:hypothetical protein
MCAVTSIASASCRQNLHVCCMRAVNTGHALSAHMHEQNPAGSGNHGCGAPCTALGMTNEHCALRWLCWVQDAEVKHFADYESLICRW